MTVASAWLQFVHANQAANKRVDPTYTERGTLRRNAVEAQALIPDWSDQIDALWARYTDAHYDEDQDVTDDDPAYQADVDAVVAALQAV